MINMTALAGCTFVKQIFKQNKIAYTETPTATTATEAGAEV